MNLTFFIVRLFAFCFILAFVSIEFAYAQRYCAVEDFLNVCKNEDISDAKKFLARKGWLKSTHLGTKELQKRARGSRHIVSHSPNSRSFHHSISFYQTEFSDLKYTNCTYNTNFLFQIDHDPRICDFEIAAIKNYLPESHKEVIDIKSDKKAVYHWTYKQGNAKKMLTIQVREYFTLLSLKSLTPLSSN